MIAAVEKSKAGKESRVGCWFQWGGPGCSIWAGDPGAVQGIKGGNKSCTWLPVGDGGIPGRRSSNDKGCATRDLKSCNETSRMEHRVWWAVRQAMRLEKESGAKSYGALWALRGLWIYSKCDRNSLEDVPLFDLPLWNFTGLLGWECIVRGQEWKQENQLWV